MPSRVATTALRGSHSQASTIFARNASAAGSERERVIAKRSARSPLDIRSSASPARGSAVLHCLPRRRLESPPCCNGASPRAASRERYASAVLCRADQLRAGTTCGMATKRPAETIPTVLEGERRAASEPTQTKGFGSFLIERAIQDQLGQTNLDFDRNGLVCSIKMTSYTKSH